MPVNFDEFMAQAWNEHAIQPLQVAARIQSGFLLVEQPDQIPAIAHLVTHLFGDHLGRWDEGIRLLDGLKRVPAYEQAAENARAIARCTASLEIAGGKRTSAAALSDSDQIRVLAVAASALAEQRDAPRAQTLFRQALDIARLSLGADDPANRALAVAANNLASGLEEKSARSIAETELMILAAQTARTYWGIAGSWLQHERAEYRLAKTYLQADDPVRSLEHAQKAMGDIVGFTTSAARAGRYFDALGADDRTWCATTLEHLR
jgi:hypothetical protein